MIKRYAMNYLKPPEAVKEMTNLDKSKFNKELSLAVIHLKNVKISAVLPLLKKYLLKLDNLKPIQTKNDTTLIYLNPNMINQWIDIPEDERRNFESMNITIDNLKNQKETIGYDNFTADDIFKSVLPSHQEGLASFTKIGHIVHVNLREHLLPYKNLIGQVLLEKVPGCTTVVNKINMIDNTYRNFKMEVLSGENNMMVRLKECNCTFEMDFSKVYWNSRLSTEHERIIKKIKSNEVLFDVFAGIGPFSIPVAKNKGFVFANDLNPESFKWLNHNIKLNKINTTFITTYNKDGKDFIKNDVKEHLLKYINNTNVYITMNLPALALEFLCSFYKLYNSSELEEVKNPPILFLYCFAKGEQTLAVTKNLILKNMGWDISDKIVEYFKVRTVSSLKEMMRVTIKLDEEILLGKHNLKRKTVDEETINKIKKS